MDDDLVFADSAGHIIIDLDAAREAQEDERQDGKTPAEDASG